MDRAELTALLRKYYADGYVMPAAEQARLRAILQRALSDSPPFPLDPGERPLMLLLLHVLQMEAAPTRRKRA